MASNNTEMVGVEAEPFLLLSEARDLLDIVYLINALLRSAGNVSRTAEELEYARRTIYELMEKYGISCAEGKISIELTPLVCHLEVRAPCLDKYLTQDR